MLQKTEFVVGTGGVGKGVLFKLIGDENLGRNESRLAELTNFKDFCKLHIIFNYVASLLEGELPVYAISAVGEDEDGRELLELMQNSKINVDYIERSDELRTMYAVCYQFPGGEGGNITTSNSACNSVGAKNIKNFFESNSHLKNGVVLAAPEVPIEARAELLKAGRERNCFNIASFLPEEAEQFIDDRLFELIDLVAINSDEAKTIAQIANIDDPSDTNKIYEYLKGFNQNIILIVTLGKNGSFTHYNEHKVHSPIIDVPVVNTAGAGDCFLGTVIATIIKGIPLYSPEQNCVATAQDIASIASTIKVTNNDTIDFSLNRQKILDFAKENNICFSKQVLRNFFEIS